MWILALLWFLVVVGLPASGITNMKSEKSETNIQRAR